VFHGTTRGGSRPTESEVFENQLPVFELQLRYECCTGNLENPSGNSGHRNVEGMSKSEVLKGRLGDAQKQVAGRP